MLFFNRLPPQAPAASSLTNVRQHALLRSHISTCLVSLLAILAFGVSTANATITHELLSPPITEVPAEEGTGPAKKAVPAPGSLGRPSGLAVDSGHLFVGEAEDAPVSPRLDEFDAGSGVFVAQLAHSPPPTDKGVAVAHASGVVYAGGTVGKDTGGTAGEVSVFEGSGVLLGTWTGTSTLSGSFGQEGHRSNPGQLAVAVDNDPSSTFGDSASGDVYVVNVGEEAVDVFVPADVKPGGHQGEEPVSSGVSTLPGTCSEPGKIVGGLGCEKEMGEVPFTDLRAVAVDQANGYVLVADGTVVDVFKPVPGVPGDYEYLTQITGPPGGSFEHVLAGLAVDGASAPAPDGGDIYVAEEGGEGGTHVDEFRFAGPAEESVEYRGHLTGLSPTSVAVDSESGAESGDLFVGEPGSVQRFGADAVIPDVKTEGPSEEKPTSVILHGKVNPLETETKEAAKCAFLWGTSEALGKATPCEPPEVKGNSETAVQALLEGLLPDATYYYQLQATNKQGTNEAGEVLHFTTPGPGIEEESASDVAGTSVTLDATIDPHNVSTSWFFEYDTRPYARGEAPHGASVPVAPGTSIGSAEGAVKVQQHVQGLTAGKVYYYRVVTAAEVQGAGVEDFDGAGSTFTTQGSGSFVLPDGRAWELVSPPEKHGALLEPIKDEWLIQGAASGDALAYVADAPTETGAQGYTNFVQALATRTSTGWHSQDLAIPHEEGTGTGAGHLDEYLFFSEDLSRAIVQPFGGFVPCHNAQGTAQPCLSEAASEQTAFVRSDYYNGNVGEACTPPAMDCYSPLVSRANDTAGSFQPFGEEGECPIRKTGSEAGSGKLICGPKFLGASPDSEHVVVSSAVPLTETTPASSSGGLYEASGGKLTLVSLLPKEEGGGAELPAGDPGLGESRSEDVRHAVSADGSRVIFSDMTDENLGAGPESRLYLRDLTAGKTLRLDLPEAGVKPTGPAEAIFQTASADDSRIFFTDTQRLVNGSAGNLYECEIVEALGGPECNLTDLTPAGGEGTADVQGAVIGASETGCDTDSSEGCYVYFVAGGALAGTAQQGAQPGAPNLYVWHDGEPHFIAVLSGDDAPDWDSVGSDGGHQFSQGFNLGGLTARVSSDGRWLAFMSQGEPTGYDNADATGYEKEKLVDGQFVDVEKDGVPVPARDEEVYLYSEQTGKLACASCDPTGARPVGEEYGAPGEKGKLDSSLAGGEKTWEANQWLSGNVPGWTRASLTDARYQSRYLSNQGRLFFNSIDGLVPKDVNGQEDVYEYEPEGVGGESAKCGPAAASGSDVFEPAKTVTVEGRDVQSGAGCVSLISSGESEEESAFLDASETGGDVFFLSSGKLAPQDFDNALDVYDAHECTTGSPCLPAPAATPPPCTTEASCKPAPEPQPGIYGPPSSATFNGPGDAPAPVVKKVTKKAVRCKRGFVKNRKGKCVRKPKKRKR